jgi:hypothetical protein
MHLLTRTAVGTCGCGCGVFVWRVVCVCVCAVHHRSPFRYLFSSFLKMCFSYLWVFSSLLFSARYDCRGATVETSCARAPLFFLCVSHEHPTPMSLSSFFFFVLPPDGLRGETCCEAELMSTLNVLSLSLLPLYSWGGREWRGATRGYFCYSHTQEKGNRINNNNNQKKKKKSVHANNAAKRTRSGRERKQRGLKTTPAKYT